MESKGKDDLNAYARQILKLKNPVMEYAWGSSAFISELTGRPSPSRKPEAELWMGAHPRGPSRVETAGGAVRLDRFIRENPDETLGPETRKNFGDRLPFLLKILAVERPLSIQAHPDRDQARRGYRRENAAGIAVDGPGRNYRDPEPKPELLSALTPFAALCGFREPEEIAVAISDLDLGSLLPEAERFRTAPNGELLRDLFRALLTLPLPEKKSLLERLADLIEEERATRSIPDAVKSWISRLLKLYPDDVGVLGPLFLNFVRLKPEEALYLAPGVLHAYLNGSGVEVMAGSDNVLRGGLTAKHIDGAELADILNCRCGPVPAVRAKPGDGVESVYRSPAEEFQLSRLLPTPSTPFRSGNRRGPEIVFCYRGRGRATGDFGPAVDLSRGDSIFIPFGTGDYTIRGEATLYRGALPPPRPD